MRIGTLDPSRTMCRWLRSLRSRRATDAAVAVVIPHETGFVKRKCLLASSRRDADVRSDSGRGVAHIQDRHTRLLTLLLQEGARTGGIELEVGPDGKITGGRVIRFQAAAVSSSHAVADLTTVPAPPGTEPHE